MLSSDSCLINLCFTFLIRNLLYDLWPWVQVWCGMVSLIIKLWVSSSRCILLEYSQSWLLLIYSPLDQEYCHLFIYLFNNFCLIWQVFNRDVPVYVGQPWNRPGHLAVCGWSGLVRHHTVSFFHVLSQPKSSQWRRGKFYDVEKAEISIFVLIWMLFSKNCVRVANFCYITPENENQLLLSNHLHYISWMFKSNQDFLLHKITV